MSREKCSPSAQCRSFFLGIQPTRLNVHSYFREWSSSAPRSYFVSACEAEKRCITSGGPVGDDVLQLDVGLVAVGVAGDRVGADFQRALGELAEGRVDLLVAADQDKIVQRYTVRIVM